MLLDLPCRSTSRINITPLIDVVFILLMFFMLATRFEQYRELEINSSFPGVAHTEDELLKMHRVTFDDKNHFLLDDQQLTIDELENALASMQLENSHLALEVFSKAGSRVQQLVSVMDILHRLEIERVELLIE